MTSILTPKSTSTPTPTPHLSIPLTGNRKSGGMKQSNSQLKMSEGLQTESLCCKRDSEQCLACVYMKPKTVCGVQCIHLVPSLKRNYSTCKMNSIDTQPSIYKMCSTCKVQNIHLEPTEHKKSITCTLHNIHLSPDQDSTWPNEDPCYLLPRPHLRLSESHVRKNHRASLNTDTKELNPKFPDPVSISSQSLPHISCFSSYSPPFSSLPSSLSCSCCLSNLRATSVVDPSSPWAFTNISSKERSSICSEWCVLLSVLSCCILALVLGLLYICQETPMMEHSMTEY